MNKHLAQLKLSKKKNPWSPWSQSPGTRAPGVQGLKKGGGAFT